MCCASARSSRSIVEECLKWGAQRYVFGKPLLSQAVIRYKLAHNLAEKLELTSRLAGMIAKVEATQAWLEQVTYQMCNMVSSSAHCYSRRALISVLQGTVAQPCWSDCVPQDAVHALRRRDWR